MVDTPILHDDNGGKTSTPFNTTSLHFSRIHRFDMGIKCNLKEARMWLVNF